MFTNIFSWFGTKEAAEPSYRSREVWSYRHIDPRTKKASLRPVLVYRKASDGMFWGLPLAKTTRRGKTLYVPRGIAGRKVSALSQMRTLKASRLSKKLGEAGEKEFAALNSSILRMLAEMAPAPKRTRAAVPRAIPQLRAVPPRRVQRSLSPFQPVYILQPRV